MPVSNSVRFAQFNASLNRGSAGQLITDLSTPDDAQAQAVAEIIQRNHPDVLLINEFDYDATNPLQAVQLFQDNYLSVSQNGAEPVSYPYVYIAPSNTGIASGFDLDNNGKAVTDPSAPGYGNDALGFGNFPGQYGLLLLSKYPIDTDNIRTFQTFRWADMPGALLPDDPTTPAPQDWYSAEELATFRLSSKSHWDVPLQINGEIIHALVSHPTPPVFDGAEDRNGTRNHDEIRFWADYITPGKGDYIYDDAGVFGGLTPGSQFVIMGDQNADPQDGDSVDQAIQQLLLNPLINTTLTPTSAGAPEASDRQGGANTIHLSDPRFDTADFADTAPGNLRSDYVLPSTHLAIADASVFWPTAADPLFRLVGEFDPTLPGGYPSSDHRLVAVDIDLDAPLPDASRNTVTGIEFLGETTFPTGFSFQNTEVGGLSGITYDRNRRVYYAVSDDRSQVNPARFYTLAIDLADGQLDTGDVTFQAVTTLRDEAGNPFAERTIDFEGIALANETVYLSSEGDANQLIAPTIAPFELDGDQTASFPIPDKFLPTADQSSGIRNNLAFESLTVSPDGRYLYTATEAALYQDGAIATLEEGSPVRILRIDLTTGQPDKEYLYQTDAIPVAADPADGFADNGLVELLALDNNGNFLALERSFAEGVGNNLRLYAVQLQNTTDLRDIEAIDGFEVDAIAEKQLLLDFGELGITLDNFEGMTLGEPLADGRQSLIVVSDNNFSDSQATKVLTFALEIQSTPAVAPTVETPPVIADEDYLADANRPLNILLVNDDGYDAAGIQVLYQALVAAGHTVTLVAPKEQQSGRGTAINTDKIFRPIDVVNYADNQWYVDGTPIVTTLAALDSILETPPDLVISGINEGENLGDGAISSGTLSAAVAALQKGIPAIAVSAGIKLEERDQDYPSTQTAYEVGASYVVDLIGQLQTTQDADAPLLPPGVGLNVNIPANPVVEGVSYTNFDAASSLGFRFGPLPPSLGEGQSLLLVPDALAPGEVPDPDSEGEQFLANHITVTPIDGNWSAPTAVRETLEDRLAAAPIASSAPLNILLVNDDGYEAKGIQVLYAALVAAGHRVTIVAPKEQQSGKGTSINTDQIFRPIEVVNYGEDQWYVDGTPIVTTLAALDSILDAPPDLVISGINEGENTGLSAISSGTLSAAVTALLRGVPSIAISAGIQLAESNQGYPSTDQAYEVGAEYLVGLIDQLQATQGDAATLLPEGVGLNINIPAVETIQGVAYTEFDPATSLGFRFGTLPPSFGEGEGLLIVPGQPSATPNPTSEGEQFLAGYITVTPFDGDWGTETDAPVVESLSQVLLGDADDPAIWVDPNHSGNSLVIAVLKDGGLATFNLDGSVQQNLTARPYGDVRYNNVDILYGFDLNGRSVDLAVATDRRNDTLAIWLIDPETRQLVNITATELSAAEASIFGIDDGTQTAYGIAAYTSLVSDQAYVFVSQREGNQIAQLELIATAEGTVTAKPVRTLSAPIPPDRELEDAQFEGMVVDRELGYLYAGQEQRGIWKFFAEPDAPTEGNLIVAVQPEGEVLQADVEGLTIYYGADGKGYLLASSQGDSSFVVFSRDGTNDYLGSFVIDDGEDGVAESDGADVINVPLGSAFPNGLLVVHDGSNEPPVVGFDDEEIQNLNTNFKFVPWGNVASAFPDPLLIDPTGYDPRHPQPQSLVNGVASGDTTQQSTVLWTRSTVLGEVTFEYSTDPEFGTIAGTESATVTDPLVPVKVTVAGLTADTAYYYRVTDAAGATAIGQFQTAAAIGTYGGLNFGVSGDWRGELSPYPAIANAADLNLDFFVLHGDTIYADYPSPAVPKAQAETLTDYYLKHSEVYGSRFGLNTWGELRASTSLWATIDDHEVINDFSGGAPAESDPRFATATGFINDAPLYETGLQAFQDYNPLQDAFYGDTGDDRTAGERKLYRSQSYGSDGTVIVLDNRSFRDAPVPEVTDATDLAQVSTFLAGSFDPNRTMLGRVQLDDLKADLLAAQENGVTWKFVMVPEPMQNLGLLAASDRFEGYAAERTEILKFITDNDIDNVVFVAADIHGTIVNNLTYQLAPLGDQIGTTAFEITTGSVAFDAPFGQTVADLAAGLGLLDPATKAFYESLPIAPDLDALPNDKDDFLKALLNQQLAPLGYEPVGLDDNLAAADGLINATLLAGDYMAAHTFGWTQFEVDPDTQVLTVTTYGIPNYTETELLANPGAVTSLTPTVVSRFEVTPTATQTGSGEDDTLRGTDGNDRLLGQAGHDVLLGYGGDDALIGGAGADWLDGNAGDDTLEGGAGADRLLGRHGADVFVIGAAGTDVVLDFNTAEGDRLQLTNGIPVEQLTLRLGTGHLAGDTLIQLNGDRTLAILQNVQLNNFPTSAIE